MFDRYRRLSHLLIPKHHKKHNQMSLHSSTPPLAAIASPKEDILPSDSMSDLRSILQTAIDLMGPSTNDESLFDASIKMAAPKPDVASWIDPVPIGCTGIKVVRQVPLSSAPFLHDDDMRDLLAPLAVHVQGPCIKTTQVASCTPASSASVPSAMSTSSDSAVASDTTSADDGTSEKNDEDDDGPRFRPYQQDIWISRFLELQAYKAIYGDCLVPHNWPTNKGLAQWVKRQRYQRKLYQDGMTSTMTPERKAMLDELGFVWDSHCQIWEERYQELLDFQQEHGHGNVPSRYPENPKLSVWVKCQRRQYKLLMRGKPSNLTRERKVLLDKVQFSWNPRNLKSLKGI